MKKTILPLFFLFISISGFAQLQVNNTSFTPAELVQNIFQGSNVYISNVKFNGTTANATMFNDQVGLFSNGATTNIGLNSGVLITTGNAQVAIGPNNSGGASQLPANPSIGDADLANLAGFNSSSIKDKASLEFDFIAQGDNINFNFVFASEEYLEWVNAGFNDTFGFFISGPGIIGPYSGGAANIAVIPNTAIPISIDTINSTTNSSYFIDNGDGSTPTINSTIQYDGFTTVLPAAAAIQCGETYHIKLVIANVADNNYDSAVFLQAGSFSSNTISKVDLVAFIDANNNGVQDAGEVNFPNGIFVTQNNTSGTTNTITVPNGIYSLYDSTGTSTYNFNYTINPEYAAYYSLSSTNYNNITIPVNSTLTYYFPIQITQSFDDVSMDIVPLSNARAGYNYMNRIVYKNNGLSTTIGTVAFNNAPQTSIATISQTGTVTNTTGFTYDYTNLAPFETRTMDVSMSVPAIPIVNINDLLTSTASITAPTGDINLTNNSASNTQIVLAAYDPNDLMESHGGKIVYNQFAPNDDLLYTIRFENVGNDNAFNVNITDVLDAKIDETSIRIVNSSNNYILERNGANLKWSFKNILLPPSVVDTPIGKGYVTFKVKLKPGYAVGDIIPNTASIVFDNNPAIITNTFNTEFVAALSTNTFASNGFVIYPNPAQKTLQLQTKTGTTIDKIIITDLSGKVILVQTQNTNQVNVEQLSNGMYFIEAFSGDEKFTSKFVKE